MAKRKSETHRYVELHEVEYLKLTQDHLILQALKAAGIEKLDIYKAAESIIEDGRVEIHLKPIEKRYR